jgi:hypothetical protein
MLEAINILRIVNSNKEDKQKIMKMLWERRENPILNLQPPHQEEIFSQHGPLLSQNGFQLFFYVFMCQQDYGETFTTQNSLLVPRVAPLKSLNGSLETDKRA